MKILLIVVLSILMVASLTSCGQVEIDYDPNESAFDAWYIMNENIRDAGSFEFSFVELMVLFAGDGDPIEIENKGVIRKAEQGDGSINMQLSISLSTGGHTNELDVYYYDEFMFFNFDGSKHKRSSDLDVALRVMYAEMPDVTLIPIITDGIGEGNRRGQREINFVLYSDAEYFDFIMDAIIDSFRLRADIPGATGVEIEIFGPIAFVVELGSNHTFVSYTLAFTTDITIVGTEETFRAYYEIVKTAEQIGDISVKAPQNIYEYVDVTD
ncbi:MAG: hypothetical protein FWD05_02930 [Oscillospiraceae bacterium]|nr:hypothetical protein [Oscillospiraceae bacterium]